jgi:hypothetical protein
MTYDRKQQIQFLQLSGVTIKIESILIAFSQIFKLSALVFLAMQFLGK